MEKILLLFLVVVSTVWAQSTQAIVVTPKIHHFGDIPDTQVARCFFTIKNNLDKVVTIGRIKTPCSCTAARPNPDTLKPGEQTKVEVVFNPKGRTGYLRWDIDIYTNLDRSPIRLPFDANILKDGLLSTDFVTFGEFKRGVTTEKKLWISSRQHPNFQLRKVHIHTSFTKPCFDIKKQETTYSGFYPGARRAYAVSITPRKDIPFGRIDGKLLLTTDIPGKEKIELPLFARVAGEIGISRDYITVGVVTSKRPSSRRFMVYHRKSKSFAIKNIKSSLSFVTTNINAIIPDQYYEVKVMVKVDSKVAAGEFRGQISLETSSKEQPLIIIPVQGFVLATKSYNK